MSTDSFNLAPAQTTAAGATTAPAPHTTPAAPAPASRAKKQQPTDDSEAGQSVAGVVVPGAALTGLISLCWMIHQFGLPAVLLGIAACAAAASAALVLKARKGAKRVSAARKAAARAAGGGGSGRTVLNRSAGGAKKPSSARTGGGDRAGGRRAGASLGMGGSKASGGKGRTPSGAGTVGKGARRTGLSGAAVKPAGLTKPKPKKTPAPAAASGPAAARTNSRKTPGTGLLAGLTGGQGRMLKTGARGKQLPTPRTPKKNTPTGGGQAKPKTSAPRPGTPAPTSSAPKAGKVGRLARLAGRKSAGTPVNPLKGAPKTLTGSKTSRKLAPTGKAARANTTTKPRTPKPAQLTPKTLKPVTAKKAAKQAAKGKKPKTLKHKPTAHMSRWRRGTYLAGVKLRKHTSKKTRMRIRRVISPARTATRTTSRLLSPPLAHAWRWGSRAFLNWHMAVGTIRYSTAGPNWMRACAKVIHVLYSPAARAVAATGSWGWLNRWMYQHTSGPAAADRISKTPAPRPDTAPADAEGTAGTEDSDWGGMFGQPFNPPTDHTGITAPTGAAPMSEYAAPLEQAIDAVRQAGAMLLTNPAENMVGYEATLRALSGLQAEIGEAVRLAGETTRENFKVNPAVADAYADTAGYAISLASRLEEIPVLYRTLHAEQIENIENPTVQARKWDITANE